MVVLGDTKGNEERHLSTYDGINVVEMPGELYSEVTVESDDGKNSLLLTSNIRALEFHDGDL